MPPCKCLTSCKGQACVCNDCKAKKDCKYVYTGDCRFIEIGGLK